MNSIPSRIESAADGNPSCRQIAARPSRRQLLLPLVAALLAACASTTPGGRSQLSAPEPISSLYSTIDLKLTLASLATVSGSCTGVQCQVDKGFERQVARLGTRLAATAYQMQPELRERIPHFTFVVAEKIEGGSSSDASGTIVIYRGVRKAPLDEEALAYLIAREMGQVIARHHDEKSAATILSSLVAQVLLAPANLARGVAFLVSSTASALGTGFVTAGTTQDRLKEADTIACDLLNRQGWSNADVADSLLEYAGRLGGDPWGVEIRHAIARINGYPSSEVLALAQPSIW